MTVLTTRLVAAMYRSMGSLGVGAASTGGVVNVFFNWRKASSALWFHTKKVVFFISWYRGESLLAEPADESADGCQTAGELLYVQQSAGYFHPLDGLDLHRVALYAA